ncbi:hypothetical protein KY290_014355 [Solanum tuberosum]|uniref:Uncharacterized protein n=1 Tax=Solanum tuberosum TaxID=4113 RepID=A0ABQ7VPH9_SOLTU|nr:hypothetical protein KY289_014417 [Solanum tuberosum]KAH0770374.1 hypothetical protein KY290_014355 [Solanum tuberosum]
MGNGDGVWFVGVKLADNLQNSELVELVWSCELGARVGVAISPERFSRCCLLGLGGFDFTGNGEGDRETSGGPGLVLPEMALFLWWLESCCMRKEGAAALLLEEERNKI